MKVIITFLLLLSFNLAKSQKDSTLFGDWVLTKLEINSTILTPDSGKYKVKITDKEFGYVLDINWCSVRDWKTIKNEIVADPSFPCTKICCDDEKSIFYENLNYTGKYHFLNNNTVLIIENTRGIFYLKRSNWSNPDL
ncbi:MAG: hypothetical protein P8Q14_07690 [Vicingaceae bacterium]|nr:hypothetical protein [Vicingaceae bacterium]